MHPDFNKQLSYRRETALQGEIVLATSEKLEQRDDILRYCTISKLWQIIVQILDTLHFWASGNVRRSSYAHWKVHTEFPISVNLTFFARCYGWSATSENRLKIGVLQGGESVSAKVSRRRRRPALIIFARLVRPINALQPSRSGRFHTKKLCSRLSSSKVRFYT